MSYADSLLLSATRLATAPIRLAAEVGQDAIDAGREAQRAVAVASEEAFLGLVDAIVVRMVSEDVIDRVIARVEAAGVAQRVVDRMLQDGLIEQIAERVLSGPELERIVASAFQSALPDEVIAQALASEAVWILVDEIARSPSVTEAIAHQGTGFLEQVASKTRDRSRKADSRVQRLAERVGRRRARSGASDSGDVTAPGQLPGGEVR